MVAEVTLGVNDLTFVVTDEFMQIELRPEQHLDPVADLPADRRPAVNYLLGLSKSTQRTQWAALCVVAGVLTKGQCSPLTLPWWVLGHQHVNFVRAWLIEHREPSTGRRVLAALRGVLRECWRLKLMDAEALAQAIDVKPIRGEKPSQAAGRALSEREKMAVLAACKADPSPAGVRDAAIFVIGIGGGLRRSEIAGLRLDDYDADDQGLTVRGKGKKTRQVYLAPGVEEILAEWLQQRGAAPGPLFMAIHRGGRVLGVGISDAAIYDLLRKRAQAAGVKPFSPHDLRRSFAGDLLDTGADIVTVQKLMGHADPKTTGNYDRRTERAKRAAMQKLPRIPWR